MKREITVKACLPEEGEYSLQLFKVGKAGTKVQELREKKKEALACFLVSTSSDTFEETNGMAINNNILAFISVQFIIYYFSNVPLLPRSCLLACY